MASFSLLKRIQNKLIGFPKKQRLVKIGAIVTMEYEHSLGYWKVRKFKGRCIGIKKKQDGPRFVLRSIINGIGVEFSFICGSHFILKIKETPVKKLLFKKSKLYFLRHTKLRLVRL